MTRRDLTFRMIPLAAAALLVAKASLAAEPTTGTFDQSRFAAALTAYVNDEGLVDYAGLKKNRADLDAYVKQLGDVRSATFDSWQEKDRLAFLINAYNAFTLRAIIDHHPIQSSFLASLRFPKNSIRQIDGVWDEMQWKMAGRMVTLEQIEHEMLRKQYAEPRIHMAINCASIGCPPLRREPYVGARLDEQLTDQTRRFLADSDKFHIDRTAKRVHLSPIFDWFGEDWVKAHKPASGFAGSEPDKSVLNFIAAHSSETDAAYLKAGGYRVRYLDYDWSLNEQ